MGPILFNIFLNDLLYFVNKAKVYNFADDNTISAKSKSKEDLLIILEQESEEAVQWFRQNQMIVNPDKFQCMIMEKKNKLEETRKLQIVEENIDTTNTVKLLELTLDNKLNFNDHISNLCKKAYATKCNKFLKKNTYLQSS